MKLESFATNAASRRTFLKGAGLAGVGLTSAAIVGAKFGGNEQKVEAASYSDVDILNFALNLEYLEAEFYTMATYGVTLVQHGVITEAETSGPTTGGKMVSSYGSPSIAYLASALRDDEINHVKYLRSALGSAAVKKPAINLNANGYGFTDFDSFLELAAQFEDVGVSAYLGAAPLISSSTYLAAAGAILATEGQHEGALRMACIMRGVKVPALDSVDIPPTENTVFFVNQSNSLSIPRTAAEVLKIVYGGGSCSGGFYPNGMNGAITCQS